MIELSTKSRIIGLLIMPIVLFMLSSTPASGSDHVIWDEAVDGDLNATVLPPLKLGINEIRGSVQGFGDRDEAQFEIPIGLIFEKFLIVELPGIDFRGPSMSINSSVTLEFINTASFHSLPLDLLQFDSAPGPQPAGTYNFNISKAQEASGGYVIQVITTEEVVQTIDSSWGSLKSHYR